MMGVCDRNRRDEPATWRIVWGRYSRARGGATEACDPHKEWWTHPMTGATEVYPIEGADE